MVHGSQNRGSWASWGPTIIFSEKKSPYLNNLSLDHMLEQFAKHGSFDITINSIGDLEIDEHHTIEDTAIALGEVIASAIGNKLGIERYGFCLPMDDCLAQVSIDFGGRNWLVWEAEFNREMIGKMPTEMFFHFFKSFGGTQVVLGGGAEDDEVDEGGRHLELRERLLQGSRRNEREEGKRLVSDDGGGVRGTFSGTKRVSNRS